MKFLFFLVQNFYDFYFKCVSYGGLREAGMRNIKKALGSVFGEG